MFRFYREFRLPAVIGSLIIFAAFVPRCHGQVAMSAQCPAGGCPTVSAPPTARFQFAANVRTGVGEVVRHQPARSFVRKAVQVVANRPRLLGRRGCGG